MSDMKPCPMCYPSDENKSMFCCEPHRKLVNEIKAEALDEAGAQYRKYEHIRERCFSHADVANHMEASAKYMREK